MSDRFDITISGDADETTRAALVADLEVIAEKYKDVITAFNLVDMPRPVAVSIRKPTDAEVAFLNDLAAQAEPAEAEPAEAEPAGAVTEG